MERPTFLLFFLFCAQLTGTDCLTCYSCQDVNSLSQCNATVTCASREVCFQQKTEASSGTTFRLGCHNNQLCGGSSSTGLNLIGRAVPHLYRKQANTDCNECCAQDRCNKQLCYDRSPGECVDDSAVDCAKLSTIVQICADIDKAKLLCPNFCGLCNIVDGAWSAWGVWSQCDVTCGIGKSSRGRTCTDPAPANGGSDCVGNTTQTRQCIKPTCPVHGGWSLWSPWGTCSVTCDVGLQRRDRTCSNPYPDNAGDHCYGDSRDDRICHQYSCADGGWSSWHQWGPCSVSCGGGQRKRSRDCDSPAPSLYGRACIGDANDVDICNTKQCTGIAFNVHHVSALDNDNVFVFNHVLLNEGNGYNISSGYFTAPVDGIYEFTAKICDRVESENTFAIEKYSHSSSLHAGYGYVYGRQSITCGSASAVIRLQTNDRVAVKLITGALSYVYQESRIQCTFGGTKISN